MRRFVSQVWGNPWLWLVVILAAFVAALLLWETSPCREGYYWEETAGCVRR